MKYFQNFKKIEFDILGNGHNVLITDFFRRTKITQNMLDNVIYYTYYNIQNGERPDTVSQKLYNTPNYHWTFGLVNPWLIDIRKDWPMSTYGIENLVNNKYKNHVFMIDDIAIATMFEIGETLQGLISNATATIIEKNINLGYIKVLINSGNFQNGELIYGLTSKQNILINAVREFKYAPHHYELVDGSNCDRFALGAYNITNYDHEINENEKRVRIRVIRPEYVLSISSLFTKLLK